MPSQKKITREAIAQAAVSILREEGPGGVNARKIAQKLNCSTQPIYSEFEGMGELKAELKHRAEQCYSDRVKLYTENSKYSPYMAYGLGFLRFAKDEKQLFRYLYFRDRRGGEQSIEDINGTAIIKVMTEKYGIPEKIAIRFHYDMAIYTYGLAVMLNTGYMDLSEETIVERLDTEFTALCGAYQINPRKWR